MVKRGARMDDGSMVPWLVPDVATFLRMSRTSVYKLTSDGEIPSAKFNGVLYYDPRKVRALVGMEMPGDEAADPEVSRPWDARDVAEYFGMTRQNVYRLVSLGKIPATRYGKGVYFDPRKVRAIVGMDRSGEADADGPRGGGNRE